jgi:metal-sulfur cluster biosynthetic enzyme
MRELSHQDRTDSVDEKLRQLRAAHAAGDLSIAMSLAVSLREALRFEAQQRPASSVDISAAHQYAVGDLPATWAQWADGWGYCKPVHLFETVGIERTGETVDICVAFQAGLVTDIAREIRMAWRDPATFTLREIPSQVYDVRREGGQVTCRLVFQADVPAHDQAEYLVFYGNANAELPEYETDLRTHGEGFGLDIENRHFVARLHRQMGQLERLTYKRQHGLELYAGGKGHGEPPCIDWAHDYVDEGNLQKLRMRNWADCPNFAVVRGPLCVRVRRWGFPHSPVHPIFTPSRVHMDQEYVFHAAAPYMMKLGKITAVKDVAIEAMRDDEWVFSGYSFTDLLWIDRQGRLHEGSVPGEHVNDLWGVGFYHRVSRDSFVALWLRHEATGVGDPAHSGPPTLHYAGHGQLWSRYPASQAQLPAGATITQENAYLMMPFADEGAAEQIERVRHQLSNPLEVQPTDSWMTPDAKMPGVLARPGETAEAGSRKAAIWNVLREVRDEQFYAVDANIVDMGYVYDVRERNGVVTVVITMPHRGRPVYEFLVDAGGGRVDEGIRERVARLPGVRDVVVVFTWEPPWSVARLTDAGRQMMGLVV